MSQIGVDHRSSEWSEIAGSICLSYAIASDSIVRAGGTDHAVFFVGEDLILKIFKPGRQGFERERRSLEFVQGRSRFVTPEVVSHGNLDGLDHLLITRLRGDEMTRPGFLALKKVEQISILTDLALGLTELHGHLPPGSVSDWREFVEDRAASFIDRQIAHGVNPTIIAQLPRYIEEALPLVPLEPSVFMHSDVHFGNLRFVSRDGSPAVSGLFDFADSRVGWHEYDTLAIGVLIIQGERDLQREFFRAYGYGDDDMDEEMRRRLMMLTMLYETSDLRRYAMRLRPDAVELDVYELEKAIWSFV